VWKILLTSQSQTKPLEFEVDSAFSKIFGIKSDNLIDVCRTLFNVADNMTKT